MFSVCTKGFRHILYIVREISTFKKIKVKKYIFVYSYPYLLNQQVYFHIIYIIRKSSYSILYVLNFMDITTESIL